MEFIGEGGFGKVAWCKHKLTQENVAIKITKNKAAVMKEAKKEIASLKLLQQLDTEEANIVRWYGCFIHVDLLCMKFELLHQSLLDYMDEQNFEPLVVSDLHAVVQQMAKALLHLESLGMIHCDVKPQNIMVVDPEQWPLRVKLIDFGLTHHISEPPSFIGTLWYKAPEVLLGLAYTEAIDMWSLGVTMAQLAVGVPLYPGDHLYDVMKYIVETQGPPPDCLLQLGPTTDRYFNRRQIDGHDTWTLKTPELIKKQYGQEFQESRQVILSCLDDIMEMMDISTSWKEASDFVDLVKHMMCLHMDERIRPADVLNHPFLVEYKPQGVADDLPVLAEENSDITTSQEDAETAAILPVVAEEKSELAEDLITTSQEDVETAAVLPVVAEENSDLAEDLISMNQEDVETAAVPP
ncbi:homeodomain-interacting protein kinase 1-like, partial [Thalassophryne amazonica]